MKLLINELISHGYAIKSGHNPTVFSCNQLIHLFSKHGLLQEARNLFDEMPDRNVFTWNAIISAHIKSHNLAQAQALFDAAPHKDSVTYNSMLSGYANSDGYETRAIDFFMQMHSVGYDALIDEFTLTRMCNLTAKLRNSFHAKQLHSFMVKTGNNLSGFAVSALVDMYSKCGCFSEAYESFNGCYCGSVDVVSKNAVVAACCREGKLDMAMELFSTQMEFNDVVSWNTMITGYAQNGYGKDAIELAVCMTNNGFKWNEHTLTSVLSACSSLKSLKLGKELHGRILKEITSLNPFISSGIVDVYCKCGNMKYAESANSLIGNENKFATTSMIVGYSSQHNMKEARRIFDSLTVKNPVVWSAMFFGYLHSHCVEDVFELFRLFNNEEKTVPDGSILASFLGACAIQATMDLGKQVLGFHSMSILGSNMPSEVGLRLLLCPLGSNIVVRTACCSVGVVLPVYSTFKAIETNNQNEQQKWLLYWAAYGTFSIAETFADKFIYWFPLYHHMKFAFLVWLQLPTTNGAKQLYMSHLRPFLLRHQANLDQLVGIMYSETGKFVSAHQGEFKFMKTIVMKILISAKHLLKNSSGSQPVPPPEGGAITGRREQAESFDSDDSNEDDDDDFVAFPDSF